MTKASLEVRLKEHGIDCAESESRRTRGSLMAALRNHWLEQCHLAGNNQSAPDSDEPTAQQQWELVSGADAESKQVAIAQVQDAMEQAREASAALHELMGTDPSAQACKMPSIIFAGLWTGSLSSAMSDSDRMLPANNNL